MPPKGERLIAGGDRDAHRWIDEGAVWPDGVDLVKLRGQARSLELQAARLRRSQTANLRFQIPSTPSSPRSSRRTDWRCRRRRIASPGCGGFRSISSGCRRRRSRWIALSRTEARDARERVVDALLASPRYGERWAQHWLDVVRYADTHGFEVNTERPNAWPYRDYVIRAFNDDTPYDRFIREQIVGRCAGRGCGDRIPRHGVGAAAGTDRQG